MKKILLSGAAILCGIAAMSAAGPVEIGNFQAVAVSPDGRYVASEIDGVVKVYDTQENKIVLGFYTDEMEPQISYSIGLGNCVSENGTVVVGDTWDMGAAFIKDGKWNPLKVKYPELINLAHSVTPDALRICGVIGNAAVSLEEEQTAMMYLPVYWDLKDDGTYGDYHVLPHPEIDVTGRVPQSASAIRMSDNGKVIVGQLVDYSGYLSSLLVYTQDDEGNWTYSQPGMQEMINPDNLTFPPYPGEAPNQPQIDEYMTDEEMAEYDEAYGKWWDNCMETGDWDYENAPQLEDYISQEGAEKYAADLAEYEKAYAEWAPKYEAFDKVLQQLLLKATPLEFNNAYITADGTYAVSTYVKEEENDDPMSWMPFVQKFAPAAFDLKEGTVKLYDANGNALVSGLSVNRTIMAVVKGSDFTTPDEAVVYLPKAESHIKLEEYIQTRNSELADWMKENMSHDFEDVDYETWEPIIIPDVKCTGVPFCTPDLSTVVCHMENLWADFEEYGYVISYVLPIEAPDYSSVKMVESMTCSLRAERGGILNLNGEFKSVTIYDANGRMVYNAVPAGNRITTGLGAGVYVVKAVAADGVKILKAAF